VSAASPPRVNEETTLRTTACPQCGAPAEVVAEGGVESTEGPVGMVRVRCVERHWFLMAEDQGSSSEALTSPSPRATSRRPPGPSGAHVSAVVSHLRHMRASVRISARTD
jgi:hypothetical protein